LREEGREIRRERDLSFDADSPFFGLVISCFSRISEVPIFYIVIVMTATTERRRERDMAEKKRKAKERRRRVVPIRPTGFWYIASTCLLRRYVPPRASLSCTCSPKTERESRKALSLNDRSRKTSEGTDLRRWASCEMEGMEGRTHGSPSYS